MRALVTGGAGGLGLCVRRALQARGVVVLAPSREELDLEHDALVRRFFLGEAPDVVFHLAALANVDECEKDPVLAVRQNAAVTRTIVEVASSQGAPVVYMSTNDVFSECQDGPFSEGRLVAPGMAYSWSKYVGEQVVLSHGGLAVRANFFTRTCRAKRSFASYVLEGALRARPFGCYTNVLSAPIFAGTLAEKMVSAFFEGVRGVLHVCSDGFVDRAKQARLICRAYGLPEDFIVETVLRDRRGRPLDARLLSERGGTCGSVVEEVARMAVEEPLL